MSQKLRFERTKITIDIAHTLLGGDFLNRSIKDPKVKQMANDMRDGHWQTDTGETLKISTKKRLVDGQNRLSAFLASGKTYIYMWICYGIKEDVVKYVDNGTPRKLEDIMKMGGYEYEKILSSMGRMVWKAAKSAGRGPWAHASTFGESEASIFNWIDKQVPSVKAEWSTHGKAVRDAYSSVNKSVPESLLFYIHYVWKQRNPELTNTIFHYLCDVHGLQAPSTSIGYWVKFAGEQRILKEQKKLVRGDRHSDPKEQLLAAAEIAWTHTVNGTIPKSYAVYKREVMKTVKPKTTKKG